ncbi:MAG: haloacid dehalogenase-like hydrolase [Deltaproteobacteria bacterium]
MIWPSSLRSLALTACLFAACQGASQIRQPRALDRLNWSERNHGFLNQLTLDYGPGGPYRVEGRRDYIVLDWDSTTAQFDVQEATTRYQAVHLRYKLTKDQFRALLLDSINGVPRLSEAYGSIPLADIHADLASDYAFLYDHYAGLGGTWTLEAVLATPQWLDFSVKLGFLYEGYAGTPGIGAEYAFPWVTYLLAGHTTSEVKALANEAISRELGAELANRVVSSPAGLPSRAGVVEASFHTGLRVIPEMQDLIATFQANGVDVFIVSASMKAIVEVFGAPGNFGYSIPPENVIAMELAVGPDGILLPRYKPGWVKTYRQGKVEGIRQVIQTGLGRNWDPLLGAGDTDGDYEMLTGFPGMKLSLLWNRVKGGDIGKLCRQAVDEQASTEPRYILQGRDENAGVTIPNSATILLGKTVPQLLAN